MKVSFVMTALLAGCAVDGMTDEVSVVDQELGTDTLDICAGSDIRCGVQAVGKSGEVQTFSAPRGLGADDLADAYSIPATGEGTPTIAIVVAHGYPKLEADLAVYRETYGLPPCTVENGCLRIVNSAGGSTLPPEAPPDSGWTVEAMLDVDMASAACPRCKLLVIQGDNSGRSLLEAQHTAVALGADVISNSWSTVEKAGVSLANYESYFDHPNVAIFAAAGDLGYNQGNAGPAYPATSAHVFSVGGTKLVRDDSERGWSESVWAKGGSSCSLSIAKPAYQSASPCEFRASADLAAVGDPSTGVAVYFGRTNGSGGWIVVGGTSASTPLVAGMFAATGNARRTPAQLATLTSAMIDVTDGSNGSCGNKLCKAEAGWDGPTGFGVPNAAALAGLPPPPPSDTDKGDAGDDGSDDGTSDDDGEDAAAGGCSTSGGSTGLLGLGFVALYILRRRAAKALTA